MSHAFIVNVEAAIYKDGQYLIIKRSEAEEYAGGLYSLVGGKIDFSESSLQVLEDNLRREVDEEIGINLGKDLKYVHSTTFMADGVQVLDVVFLSPNVEGSPYIKSPEEITEIKWMTCEDIQGSSEIPLWTKTSVRLAEKLRKSLD
ncbi:NUDIX hydrolase [Camelliibacillus cellulosilyticus]|uniref:NUDIX hydrolase n=1 Tax=Camelliibacillus cellulosilyticus TaxID=2174486 RepID=A0ABV9GS56_9BACL